MVGIVFHHVAGIENDLIFKCNRRMVYLKILNAFNESMIMIGGTGAAIGF